MVIDVQIVTDSINLETANESKRRKYSNEDFKRAIRNLHGTQEVEVIPATLNWRGVWCTDSAEELLLKKTIKKTELALLGTRVLIGTFASHSTSNKTTMVRKRQGIG